MVARDDKLSSAFLLLLKVHILIVSFLVSETIEEYKTRAKKKNKERQREKVSLKNIQNRKEQSRMNGEIYISERCVMER